MPIGIPRTASPALAHSQHQQYIEELLQGRGISAHGKTRRSTEPIAESANWDEQQAECGITEQPGIARTESKERAAKTLPKLRGFHQKICPRESQPV